MRVGVRDARAAIPLLFLAACEDEQVTRVAREVAALGEYIDLSLCGELLRRLLEGKLIRNLCPRQDAEFGNVRRDDLGEREELLHEHLDGLVHEQLGATRRDHDGVHDDMLGLIGLQFIRDDMDQRRRGDHADLDGIGPYVLEDRIELCCQELRRGFLHHADALRVLRCQRRDGAHAVDTVGQHRLEIRLHAGAAARIAARDRQYFLHMNPSCMSRKNLTHPSYNASPCSVKEIRRFPSVSLGFARLIDEFIRLREGLLHFAQNRLQ